MPNLNRAAEAAAQRAAAAAAQRAAMQAQNAATEKARAAATAAAAKAKASGPLVYTATKLQRQVAESHARAYMAALRRAEAAEDAEEAAFNEPEGNAADRRLTKQETSQGQKSRTSPSAQSKTPPTKKPQVSEKDSKKKTPAPKKKKKKKKPRKKRPRYIAITTVKDRRASPKAKKVVMIFDTHAERLVGNNVYDLESVPPLDSTLKFETYSIAYVGDGIVTP
jgi:hypothetical protein